MLNAKSRSVVVESMEPRLFMDASQLTETIDSSTLPTAISDRAVLRGNLSMTITNNSGETQKILRAEVGFLISNGTLDVPNRNYALLKSQLANLSIADGASQTFHFAVLIPPRRLADGVDTLTAVVVEPSGAFSQSASGPTLTVHPPINTFSETENILKLPDSTMAGSKFHITDQVFITNSGGDPSTDPITIGIYATPDGIPADGALMTSLHARPIINPGKTVMVPVVIAAIPALATGSYQLVTQVTQANGTLTNTDPATAPVVTITVPTTGVQFSDTIVSDTPAYAPEQFNGSQESLQSLNFSMSIKNTGTLANNGEQFNLFASNNPTFDSSAIQIGGPVPLNLVIAHNAIRTFLLDFNVDLSQIPNSNSDIVEYVFVQTIDPTGNATVARIAAPLKLAGSIV